VDQGEEGDRAAQRERGFTLLEVLIAFVIAGLALAVLYHLEVTSLTEIHTAARYQEAVARARSHMAVALHGEPLTPSDRQGDDGGGFHWRIRIVPVAQTALTPMSIGPQPAQSLRMVLYSVVVLITWGDGESSGSREVRLETEQIGEAAR
jgi:general secretion pathway protein I